MRSFEQYDEAHEYFTEVRLANEVQAQLQLYDLSLGEYLVNKYAIWLDFKTINENALHGTGRQIGNTSRGNQHTGREENGINWGSQGLHLPNHGCSVEHLKWCIRFCSILDY